MSPGRRLAVVCAALVAAAAALGGASALSWYVAEVPAAGRAPVRVVMTGAQVLPGLGAVALLAVAGVAAVVALAGPVRRILGALFAVAAGALAVAVAAQVTAPPSGTDIAGLPGAPAGATPPADIVATLAPLLAGAGIVALFVAAGMLLRAEPTLPRFGARYATEGERRTEPDPDRAVWDALDAGRDPTEDAVDLAADPAPPDRRS